MSLIIGMSCDSQYEHLNIISGDTVWYNNIPVLTRKKISFGDVTSAIRSRLDRPKEASFKEIGKDVSPALELIVSNTDDKTFLQKTTLKHSISDLSSLSGVDRVMSRLLPSCDALSEGPKIFFPTCPGDLVVVTIAGSMKMTCNEIEKRVFYGPVTIKTISCQQSFIFEMECSKKEFLGFKNGDCGGDSSQWTTTILISLVCFLICFIIIATMWLIGMNKGLDTGTTKIPFSRVGCYYIASYNEFMGADGKVKFQSTAEESEVNMINRRYRKHWLVLLLLFLICRFPSVHAYRLETNYDSTKLKYSYQLTLSDSERIEFGSNNLEREIVVHTGQLTELFSTGEWKLDTKEEYFCQWYKCEAMSICGMSTLPFIELGPLAQDLFQFKHPDRSFFTYRKLQGYCTFGNGCKLIAFEVNLVDDHEYVVYSINSGGSHGGTIHPPIGCIIEDTVDKSGGILLDQLLVYKDEENSYLCNRDLFSRKPEIGMLGDLQILKNSSYHFASNEIICVADQNDRALCRYGKSFISMIESLCTRVSKVGFKIDIDMGSSLISWKQSGEASVTLRCDRKLPFKTSMPPCREFRIKVWEVAHLDSKLLLSFYAESDGLNSTYNFPGIVHMKSHQFKCDGTNQFTELYDIRSLNSSGIEFYHELIPYSALETLQEDHFSDKDPETNYASGVWNDLKPWVPSIGTSTLIIIAFVVFFILLMCRK